MGAVEVRGFLTHLAAERKVSASTQNQALSEIASTGFGTFVLMLGAKFR
jgi:hypothetical protein